MNEYFEYMTGYAVLIVRVYIILKTVKIELSHKVPLSGNIAL